MSYEVLRKFGKAAVIRRLSDSLHIPLEPLNRDYQEFLKWNAEQPVPLDLSDQAPPAPTPVEIRNAKLGTPRMDAAQLLIMRQMRGGPPAPAWAINLVQDALQAIDAAGDA